MSFLQFYFPCYYTKLVRSFIFCCLAVFDKLGQVPCCVGSVLNGNSLLIGEADRNSSIYLRWRWKGFIHYSMLLERPWNSLDPPCFSRFACPLRPIMHGDGLCSSSFTSYVKENDHLFGPEVKRGCKIQIAVYLSRFISGTNILHCWVLFIK